MDYLSEVQQLVLLLFATVLVIDLASDFKNGEVSLTGTGGTIALPFLVAIAIVLAGVDFYFNDRYDLQILFALTFVLGVLLVMWAGKHLGHSRRDFFRRHPHEGRTLVTTGPYAHVRHPIYTGMIIAYIGLLLLFFNPVTLLLAAVYFTVLIVTAVSEERFLHETLPGYADYKQKTGRFLPKLRRAKKA